MKNTLPARMARCLLTCALAGGPIGLLAQRNIQVAPSYELIPRSPADYALNLRVSLNTPNAVVQAEHYPEGSFQANYTTTSSVNGYDAVIPLHSALNQGLIRVYSTNAPATTFTADLMYTIVTSVTLRNSPKVTDRLGKVSFTLSDIDRFNSYAHNLWDRLMIVSTDYAPLLSGIPKGWRPVSALVSVAAATTSIPVRFFRGNGLLEIGYLDWGLEPAEELTMSLFRLDEYEMVWEKLACPQPDTLRNRVTVNIDRTGTYVLLSMLSVNKAAQFVTSNQQAIQVAATSLRTASVVDTLGELLARGSTEIILSPGFYIYPGGRFDTQLTGSYGRGGIYGYLPGAGGP
jgi:hypothetical protein